MSKYAQELLTTRLTFSTHNMINVDDACTMYSDSDVGSSAWRTTLQAQQEVTNLTKGESIEFEVKTLRKQTEAILQ